MSDPLGITHGLSAHRRGLVAAVLGVAVVAGAISYVLIERATRACARGSVRRRSR